jgi:hypothetical protein
VLARMRRSLGIAVSLCLLLAGAAAGQDWFDAYARGLDALKQGNGAKAAEWLERAIRKRSEPGTNVLTYGTNRLDRYHPYLYLAEAHLLAGNPEAARVALDRSAEKGKEPAAERDRIAGRVTAEIEKRRIAAATTAPTAPPTQASTQAPTQAVTAPPTAAPTTITAAPTALAAAPRAASTGTLEVRSDPAGATVLLGTRLAGMTPLTVDVAPGAYDVTLRKEGAADLRFPVQVQAGRRTIETRVLVLAATPGPAATPAAETAALVIVTQPPGVAVYVDDVPLGTTDPRSGRLVKGGLEPGSHRVRLSRPGYEDVAEDVSLAAGPPTAFERTLAREGGSLSPLVPIAAVVVVATLGFVLWTRARRPAVPAAMTTAGGPATTTSRRTVMSPQTVSNEGAAAANTAVEGLETAALQMPVTPAPGTRLTGAQSVFGEYALQGVLGKGGMASVFRAERRGEVCALKRPLSAFLEDPEFLERFLREAEIGRTLHHPNIIRIFERGEVGGVPYFTMELVEGETLQDHFRRVGALDARSATKIVAQVAEALDYAHLKGVVHRDLKPSNIMILRDGTVKVMDYGIARARRFEGLTVTGAFLGTPDYVAPETAEGKGTDARSDLYSLGIVFYEILTGKRPFSADTPFATLQKHCAEPPRPPTSINAAVPKELEVIILRLLNKKPDDRYPAAEDLLIALRDFLNRAA